MEKTLQLTINLANAQPGDIKESAALVRSDAFYTSFECTDSIHGDVMTLTATIPDDEQAWMDHEETVITKMADEYTAHFVTARTES